MADQTSPYQTLPTVVASLHGEARERELRLTIIFHPDVNRIGETAVVEQLAGEKAVLVGRLYPCFGRDVSAGLPLTDRYISREALCFRSLRDKLVLSKNISSCRVQVDGTELVVDTCLDNARLDAGVSILIGGRIVLLLRRVETNVKAISARAISGAMLGSSVYMAKLRVQIYQLANTDLDLLIRGETGTGKELVAQALHASSNRASKKMVAVNMAAIPVPLAPSALFGNAKGAFSGADKATLGYFREADGGTLFLDEVGDTPVEIQAQLLRVLQQREVQSVGGPISKVNLRVISATDVPLDADSCSFKAALRHRLGESEITLLPLREHPEDIGELLWEFIQKNMSALGRTHLLPAEHSEATEIAGWAEVFYQFSRDDWPGNIRQLENYAQQVAVASEDTLILPDVVAEHFGRRMPGSAHSDASVVRSSVSMPPNISDEAFRSGLESSRYEVARAARQLGISRQSVYRRIADASDLCLACELPPGEIQAALDACGGSLDAAALHLKVSRSALRAHLRYLPEALAG